MKKLLLALLALLFIMANGQGENFVKVETKSPIKFGEIFIVNITIEADEPVMGIQFDVVFNGLEAISIEKGDFFDYWANDFSENFTVIDNENGSIYDFVAFSDSPVTGEGVVAIIYFRSIEEGIATVNLTNVILADENGNATDATILNTTIYIDATPPSISNIQISPSSPTPSDSIAISADADDTSTGNNTITICQVKWDTTWHNMSANYNTPSESPTYIVC